VTLTATDEYPVVVDGASVAYNGVTVLDGLELRVGPGAWVGVIGPNGAGKTTLLRTVMGLARASGDVRLDGTSVGALDRRRLARLVAYVPQRPVTPEGMTVTDYVLLGRTPYIPYLGYEGPTDLAIVHDALERLELVAFAERRLETLSGGEMQRALLARALVQEAPILLLDEPTTALDIGHQQQALELVDELRRERHLTVLSAMHDLTLAAQFADELLLLKGGRSVAFGSPKAVLTPELIRSNFGASVRISEDAHGRVVVIATRERTDQ
jgi:iron complex transport system ATP-binding protein